MFTGLVTAVGRIERVERAEASAEGTRIAVASSLGVLAAGESVAVSGVCLTVTSSDASSFTADLSPETLAVTTLGRLGPGSRVNLERAALVGDRLGGHLVAGHVDGVARVLSVKAAGDARELEVDAPPELARFIAAKGSVTLDGVSLTVNRVHGSRFELMLVPHTLAVTTLGEISAGRSLNLEVDLVARYVARYLEAGVALPLEREAPPSARRGVG
jgi:riboflavin synthase